MLKGPFVLRPHEVCPVCGVQESEGVLSTHICLRSSEGLVDEETQRQNPRIYETFSANEGRAYGGLLLQSNLREEPVGILQHFDTRDVENVLLLPRLIRAILAASQALVLDQKEGTNAHGAQIIDEISNLAAEVRI